MKKNCILAVCGLLAVAACQELPATDASDGGTLRISVKSDAGVSSKALTDPVGNDAAIHDTQLFLFASDGSLYRCEMLDENELSHTLTKVKAGSYQVVAVVNAPALSTVQSKDELEQTAIDLGLNDPERGFVMYGEAVETVTVEAGATTEARAEVTIFRHVGRIRLGTVKNNLPPAYGDLSVEYAFIENGLGVWDYGGTGSPEVYVNYAGRLQGRNGSSAPADFITSATDADYAALTFHSLTRIVENGTTESFGAPFYTYPNSVLAVDDHFGATDGAACVRLVLKAVYGEDDSQSWYYPVTIPNVERNKSYDVSFVIGGPGTDDPNGKVDNSNLRVVITVEPWEDGGDFIGEF